MAIGYEHYRWLEAAVRRPGRAVPGRARSGANLRPTLGRNRRLLVAVGAFVAIFVYLDVLQPGPISYFEINFLSSNTGPLAFAAMGQTVVFLIGGFDLSCGAVLSLVNVIMALHTSDDPIVLLAR